jgi:hypothetical protein
MPPKLMRGAPELAEAGIAIIVTVMLRAAIFSDRARLLQPRTARIS